MVEELTVIGGGLAGSEAAWQAANRGVHVKLYEMRPGHATGAHVGGQLAELICSNSLGSDLPDRASGLLKNELRAMGSLLIRCAEQAAVPAGSALAVDRETFAGAVTRALEEHPNVTIYREEATEIPEGPAVIASGPLTSARLSDEIAGLLGQDHLYFFDAIAPILYRESINLEVAFRASRYGRGIREQGDYLNCPLTEEEYRAFHEALVAADRIELKSFEQELESGVRAGMHTFFEGCLPVEILARRGEKALAYGPMRPVGLTDPRTGRRPYAVLQLRQDDLANRLYNMVGFQTNLTFPEQRRVFRLIPGLEEARFARYGQMHRNTFIFSPRVLEPTLQMKGRPEVYFAGQITGVEGYVGNMATGLLAGWNAARMIKGDAPLRLPRETMLGALCHYVTHASEADFQPMKANFGVLPALEDGVRRNRRERAQAYAARAERSLVTFLDQAGVQARVSG